jgi:membrane dipeptidase
LILELTDLLIQATNSFIQMTIKLISVIILSFVFSAAHSADYQASEKAQSLAKSSIIVDGHIDVPYRLQDGWVDVTSATPAGDFDYPRAKQGGLNAPFMSIYTPASLGGAQESTALAHKLIDYVEAIVGRAPNKFAIAKSTKDLHEHFAAGLISLPLGMENGSPINGDLNNLKMFYDRGVRYITLAHSKSNAISDSSYDETRQWGGLSPFGETVVAEMNRLGIMVDISHVSDEAFYDVMRATKVPAIASHSSLRTFTPGFERNMDDGMIKALAKNGGVIMINFGSTFVDAKAREWSDIHSADLKLAEEKFAGKESEEYKSYKDSYRDNKPLPFADLNKVIEHIDYAVKLVGVDHVGLGSDYDGVGDSLPIGLKDVSTYPNLVQGLLDKNYSNEDIKKILGENLIRVWAAAEVHAQSVR